MRKLNRTLELSIVSLAIAFSSPALATTIVTPQTGGNSNDGTMFDIQTGANALTLTSIGANIFGTASYEIYYKSGSINGNVTNPPAWTLLGSFSNVVGFGSTFSDPGGLVEFDISDLALAANATYGLYITQTVSNLGSTSGVRYTGSGNAVTIGTPLVADSNLTILNGRGASYAFTGISNFGRSFNGSLSYTVNAAVPEPATWAMMIGGFGAIGGAMRYRRRKASVSFA